MKIGAKTTRKIAFTNRYDKDSTRNDKAIVEGEPEKRIMTENRANQGMKAAKNNRYDGRFNKIQMVFRK